MKKTVEWLLQHKYLLFLWMFVVLTRLPLLNAAVVPFQFDHGKDAIAVFHMWQTVSPKLIGPWTSIPGLFFGPAWYYLLLPGMVITQGAPIASVVTMLLLGLVAIWVVHTYFGRTEASILAFSSLFYTITSSAWNPFPMVLVSFVILAALKHVEQVKKLSTRSSIVLGVFSALGFHFSTAFAVLYPVLIALSLVLKKVRLSLKQVAIILAAFFIPFIPQLLFEIRHGFVQFKSVLRYLQTGDSDPASLDKLMMIVSAVAGEVKGVVAPSPFFANDFLNRVIEVGAGAIMLAALFRYLQKKQYSSGYLLLETALWFSLPLLAFTFLHFNVWYLLPLFALTVVMTGEVLRAAPRLARVAFVGIFCVVSLSKMFFFLTEDKENLLAKTSFLPNKQAALDYIYERAGDKPFASYHYMPDIYDYPYQYLYFLKALHGNRLPTEFSYQPGETSYIPEKAELMEVLASTRDTRQPELIFYVIDGSVTELWYTQWLNYQNHGGIIDERRFSESLVVYTASPN